MDTQSITTAIVRTDNTCNYQNNVVSVVSPIIFKQYGVILRVFINNEPLDGKGHVDIHYATCMTYVDRYIEMLTSLLSQILI